MSTLQKLSACALSILVLACGCAHREAGREIPKEVAVSAPPPQSQQGPGEEAPPQPEQGEQGEQGDSSWLTVKKKQPDTLAKITVTAPSTGAAWSTQDEVLAQNLYDLIHIVNERFSTPLDIREHDFVMTVTGSGEEREEYKLWVNYVRENEVIVEDGEGNQWNLSIPDSNAVRRILSSLNG